MDAIRFAFSLPLEVEFKGRTLKAVMKRALGRMLLPRILAKPRSGFTFNPHCQIWEIVGFKLSTEERIGWPTEAEARLP